MNLKTLKKEVTLAPKVYEKPKDIISIENNIDYQPKENKNDRNDFYISR